MGEGGEVHPAGCKGWGEKKAATHKRRMSAVADARM